MQCLWFTLDIYGHLIFQVTSKCNLVSLRESPGKWNLSPCRMSHIPLQCVRKEFIAVLYFFCITSGIFGMPAYTEKPRIILGFSCLISVKHWDWHLCFKILYFISVQRLLWEKSVSYAKCNIEQAWLHKWRVKMGIKINYSRDPSLFSFLFFFPPFFVRSVTVYN